MVGYPAGTWLRAVEMIRAGYATRDEVALDIFEYIEVAHSRARVHSAAGLHDPDRVRGGQLAGGRRSPEGGVESVNGIG